MTAFDPEGYAVEFAQGSAATTRPDSRVSTARSVECRSDAANAGDVRFVNARDSGRLRDNHRDTARWHLNTVRAKLTTLLGSRRWAR